MVGISIYNDKEIDTDSLEIKETISTSIKDYIINNWDQCVTIEQALVNDIYTVQFSIEL